MAGLLTGETDAILSFIVDFTTDDGLVYYCEVTDSSGTVESAHATLTVTKKALVWLTEPLDVVTVDGEEAVFSATADGNPTVSYQWYETVAGILAGETSTSLSIQTTLADDTNSYYCIATDGYGETWQSGSGILTVLAVDGQGAQDIRMKTPSGQWIKIFNERTIEYAVTSSSVRDPSTGQAGAQRILCANSASITITLNGFDIGDTVTVIRTNAAVTIDTGDGQLINGQASQTMPSVWDAASLVLTALGWVAI